jgi:N-acetylmuramoyl-L-alanine amidase
MNYVIDHIPRGRKRPDYPLDWQYITIHNTGNPDSNARGERAWLTNKTNTSTTGYHIAIDSRVAIECIPLTENAWHAGDGRGGPGNRESIGIEICESGDFDKTMKHAVELVVHLLRSKDKGVECLAQHHGWSGKNCPRLIRAGQDHWTWERFLEEVGKGLSTMSKHFKDLPAKHWAAGEAEYLNGLGMLNPNKAGNVRPNDNITRIEVIALLGRAVRFLSSKKGA